MKPNIIPFLTPDLSHRQYSVITLPVPVFVKRMAMRNKLTVLRRTLQNCATTNQVLLEKVVICCQNGV